MNSSTLQHEIEEAVPRLFNIANEFTWNKLSDNCKFILTEIKDSNENFLEQRLLRKKQNENKAPVTLQEFMPSLQKLYDNLYDINLHIYKATKNMTIIDVRYYLKSSLDEDYIQNVLHNPPMLHCKVSMPPWLSNKKEKYDINWELNEGVNKLRMFWLKLKLKTKNS
jgi:hypothetical protein